MANQWRFAVPAFLLLATLGLSSELCAQGTSRVMNMNTHEGKYSNGGFGVSPFVALPLAGNLYRGSLQENNGRPFVRNNREIERNEKVFGLGFDFQFGSNNEVVGTNVSLDVTSYNIESTIRNNNRNFSFDFNATTLTLGFDFTINLWKSENIEPDSRRTRELFNLSLLVGPKLTHLLGDLRDLNGLAAAGLKFGLGADIPFSDSFQIAPSSWFEANWHFTPDAQSDIFNGTDSGLTSSGVPNFDGVLIRSHTLIPPYAWHLGSDFIFTPLLVGRDGDLINNWRFSFGMYFTVPMTFNGFFADEPGDPLNTEKDGAAYLTLALGVAYFW